MVVEVGIYVKLLKNVANTQDSGTKSKMAYRLREKEFNMDNLPKMFLAIRYKSNAYFLKIFLDVTMHL